jgi:hypothetical protein
MAGEIKSTSSARSDISKKLGSIDSGKFGLLKKVKLEGGKHCVRAMKVGFVPPLYA